MSKKFIKFALLGVAVTVGAALLLRFNHFPLYQIASLPHGIVTLRANLPESTPALTPHGTPAPTPNASPKASHSPTPPPSYPRVSPLHDVGLPVQIIIPSIAVNAAIEEVGKTKDGAMDVPRDPMHAGWFSLNSRPGEEGNAVIDGHVDWYYGKTGVFKRLSSIRAGDKIKVQDENGKIISFVVRRLEIFGSKANAATVFSSSDGRAHLNLITCIGVWDKKAKSYTQRLAVFADLE